MRNSIADHVSSYKGYFCILKDTMPTMKKRRFRRMPASHRSPSNDFTKIDKKLDEASNYINEKHDIKIDSLNSARKMSEYRITKPGSMLSHRLSTNWSGRNIFDKKAAGSRYEFPIFKSAADTVAIEPWLKFSKSARIFQTHPESVLQSEKEFRSKQVRFLQSPVFIKKEHLSNDNDRPASLNIMHEKVCRSIEDLQVIKKPSWHNSSDVSFKLRKNYYLMDTFSATTKQLTVEAVDKKTCELVVIKAISLKHIKSSFTFSKIVNESLDAYRKVDHPKICKLHMVKQAEGNVGSR